jgi:hypothetical protein
MSQFYKEKIIISNQFSATSIFIERHKMQGREPTYNTASYDALRSTVQSLSMMKFEINITPVQQI